MAKVKKVSSLQGSQSLVHTVRTVYTGCNHFTPFYLASVKLHEKNPDLYHSQSFATGHRYLSFANHEKIPEWYSHRAILGHSSSSLFLQDSAGFHLLRLSRRRAVDAFSVSPSVRERCSLGALPSHRYSGPIEYRTPQRLQ